MLKDLHIHIERGDYTRQWIERFVNQAVKMNIGEINLLEHSIRIKEFHPTFKEAREYNLYQKRWFEGKREQAHTMAEYKALIDEIRSADYPVKINFGLEICWFEQHEDFIREIVSDGYFDCLIGSVHWIDNWTFNQRKYQWLGKDADYLYKRYYEMSHSLIESDIFDIIAHPDLIRCHSIYPKYDLAPTYKSLCEAAKAHNVMIEMNTSKALGINDEFLDVAKSVGVSFSTGSDAHRPEDVGRGIEQVSKLIF
ncbi:MAG: PHP domain-containing protein [Eubacterium sp.]